jgi:hypothetical protein
MFGRGADGTGTAPRNRESLETGEVLGFARSTHPAANRSITVDNR